MHQTCLKQKEALSHALSHHLSLSPCVSLCVSLALSLSLCVAIVLSAAVLSATMARIAKEVSGQVLCFIGFVGVCLTCGLPMWRSTSFIGANIVTAQTIWEGIWMNCVVQSTGQMQCKVYDSMLALPQDLQAARAMTIIAIILGVRGLLISIM